jgi:hypothetical protein
VCLPHEHSLAFGSTFCIRFSFFKDGYQQSIFESTSSAAIVWVVYQISTPLHLPQTLSDEIEGKMDFSRRLPLFILNLMHRIMRSKRSGRTSGEEGRRTQENTIFISN